MVYLKNLGRTKIIIQEMKTSVYPESISIPLSEEEVSKSKEIQTYIANELIEVVEMDHKEAIALRKRDLAAEREYSQKIDQSLTRNVKGSVPDSVSSGGAGLDALPGVSSIVPPDAGTMVQGGASHDDGTARTPQDIAGDVQEEFESTIQRLNEKKTLNQIGKDAKKNKLVEVEEDRAEMVGAGEVPSETPVAPERKPDRALEVDNDEVVLPDEPASCDNNNEELLEKYAKEVEEFRSLKFFGKKPKIGKIDDVELIEVLLTIESNDTIKSLLNQRLTEL